MIKVLIVDDHDLVRDGIQRIVASDHGMEVTGAVESGEAAQQFFKHNAVDVVLMDINMPGMGGLEATRRIFASNKRARIIILTVHANAPFPSQLLEAGASGYLTKGCAAEELLKAIRMVHGGKRYISHDIAQQLALSMLPGRKRSSLEELTSREMEVMMLLVQGQEIPDIAEALHINDKTVRTHKAHLFEKLEIKNAVDLTHIAIRHGILEMPQSGSVPTDDDGAL